MNRANPPLVAALLIFLTCPAFALDFTVDDFDAAPENENVSMEMADTTHLAIVGLMGEITAVYTDSEGNRILKAMPLPMELVALNTQADIFENAADTREEMEWYVEGANMVKPGPNHFDFILDGESSWVNRNVSVWYIPEEDGTQGIMIPTEVVNIGTPDADGNAVSEYTVIAETPEELQAFLAAASVKLVIEDEEGMVEPITLDIGFWRAYGLFDLRTVDEAVDETTEEAEPVEE